MKKLLTLLAASTIAISSVFAVVPGGTTVDNTPDFNNQDMSVSGGDATVLVVDATDMPMEFVLEAITNDGWVDANDKEVYNDAWDARNNIDANFRVRAVAGSYSVATGIKITVSVGNLLRNGVDNTGWSDYHDAGTGSLSEASTGNKFASGAFDLANGVLPISTSSNHFYGESGNEEADSLNFTISYDGDSTAPAGRYESDITLTYEAQ